MMRERIDGWQHEDELPDDLSDADYSAMYPMSRLTGETIGVRVFPYRLVKGEKVFLRLTQESA